LFHGHPRQNQAAGHLQPGGALHEGHAPVPAVRLFRARGAGAQCLRRAAVLQRQRAGEPGRITAEVQSNKLKQLLGQIKQS